MLCVFEYDTIGVHLFPFSFRLKSRETRHNTDVLVLSHSFLPSEYKAKEAMEEYYFY